MSKEKHIEEMAKHCPCYFGEKCCIDGELPEKCDMLCQFGTYAEILYTAGYRKQSEVAMEIFEEIEKFMNSLDRRYMASGNPKQSWGVRGAMAEIAELKKKYTGENT